jgi:hypothetical protein
MHQRIAPLRRRRFLAVAGAIVLLAPAASACGDDPSDAPGGSGPTTTPSADTGTVTSDSQVSSADEGHPTVPAPSSSTQEDG